MSDAVLSIQDASAQMIAAGQMFEIERTTVKGIEMNVWKNAPATMAQVLGMSLNHSAKEFLIYEDQRYTFEEHYRAAATLAHRFIELGIKKGDRITIASRNLPQWVMSFWGAILAGAVVVPLNAWWTTEELEYGLSDSGTSIAIVDEERFDRISPFMDSLPELTTVIVLNDNPKRNSTSQIQIHELQLRASKMFSAQLIRHRLHLKLQWTLMTMRQCSTHLEPPESQRALLEHTATHFQT